MVATRVERTIAGIAAVAVAMEAVYTMDLAWGHLGTGVSSV